eukprot:Nitzschia sp. Nitz4//scaffold63_size106090//28937//30136//NITZ4_004383-RA/size106090-processed-gene-0.120-mRNA-1//1//CDS//3329555954//5145//frame0
MMTGSPTAVQAFWTPVLVPAHVGSQTLHHAAPPIQSDPQQPPDAKPNVPPIAQTETATQTSSSTTASTTPTSPEPQTEQRAQQVAWQLRLNVFEKAKTVTSLSTAGTLCTTSTRPGIQGSPFGSYVDYILDDMGNPVFLLNDRSVHTQNIQSHPMVSLFAQLNTPVAENDSSTGKNSDATAKQGQLLGRCSLVGVMEKIDPLINPAPDLDLLRMRFRLTHTYAEQILDSPHFSFYRMVPQQIYYVGGFGVAAQWIQVEDYQQAKPDLLAHEAPHMIHQLNQYYTDDLLDAARMLLLPPPQQGTPEKTVVQNVRVTSIDRLGMDVRVTRKDTSRRSKEWTDEFRIGFRIPVVSVEDAKSEIQKILQEGWEKARGIDWGDQDEEQPGSTVPVLKIASDGLE